MKTFSAKPHEVKREWFVVDATDKVLGRLATAIARRLRYLKHGNIRFFRYIKFIPLLLVFLYGGTVSASEADVAYVQKHLFTMI
jgi:hypothetical protein